MKHKGFTLTELMIVLALSGVILVSIFSMIVSVTSFNRIRSERAIVNDELILTKKRICELFSKYDTKDCLYPLVSQDGSSLTVGGNTVISFDTTCNELKLGTESYPMQTIERISFEGNTSTGLSADGEGTGDTVDWEDLFGPQPDANRDLVDKRLVKCTVFYQEDEIEEKYVFLLLRRSFS